VLNTCKDPCYFQVDCLGIKRRFEPNFESDDLYLYIPDLVAYYGNGKKSKQLYSVPRWSVTGLIKLKLIVRCSRNSGVCCKMRILEDIHTRLLAVEEN